MPGGIELRVARRERGLSHYRLDAPSPPTAAGVEAFLGRAPGRIARVVRSLILPGAALDRIPDGTFYAWGNVSNLPPPLNDGMGLFRAALGQKVIVVPGEFFDVNPGKRRHGRASRFRDYVRFSFGPARASLDRALVRLEDLVASQG